MNSKSKSTLDHVKDIVKRYALDRPDTAPELRHQFQLLHFPISAEEFNRCLWELRFQNVITDKNPMEEDSYGKLLPQWLYVGGD